MSDTPPGWYDDGSGVLRWWDGGRWTTHVAESTPGATADPAVASAVAERPTSRLWILWVALAAVMLAIIVGAALTIPALLNGMPASGLGPAGSAGGREAAESADVLTPEAEEGAVGAVQLFDHAWQSADCEEYFATTTEDYRVATETETCEDFYVQSRGFMDSVVDYSSTVDEVKAIGASVAVSTVDRYDAYWDKEGEPTETLHPYTDYIEYLVIEVDGEWRVDNWFFNG
ncbi:MAG: DUF2510 domain-containing protein [Microbacterium sp.]